VKALNAFKILLSSTYSSLEPFVYPCHMVSRSCKCGEVRGISS
jgi:hypothetical protein